MKLWNSEILRPLRLWDSETWGPLRLWASEILKFSEILSFDTSERPLRLRLWDSWILWDSETLRLLRLWDSKILRPLRLWDSEILRLWDLWIWDSKILRFSETPELWDSWALWDSETLKFLDLTLDNMEKHEILMKNHDFWKSSVIIQEHLKTFQDISDDS